MTIFQSIILGIIQGITEFLPISSSGHLVIVPYLLGWKFSIEDAFIFDVLVQVATLAGVIVYFRHDLYQIAVNMIAGLASHKPFQSAYARLGWLLILATVPASLFGLALKSTLEQAFSNPLATGSFLLLTAFLLVIAEKVGKREKTLSETNWQDAIWIGSAQILALFPGVSRSGATIMGGMLRSLDRTAAARFSFLMSIPVMLAAGLSASIDLIQIPHMSSLLPIFLPGFIAAAITGYIAIYWLLRFLTRHPLYGFSLYCAGLGLITIIVYLIRI